MKKTFKLLMALCLSFSILNNSNTVKANIINENPYEIIINFVNNTKMYKNKESAKEQAMIDFANAVNYIKSKLNLDGLDFDNQRIKNTIFASVLDSDISDELRDELFGLAEVIDIYSYEETNEYFIEPYQLVPNDPGPGGSGVYNATKAVEYAKRYALNYNPNYRSYEADDADCANFMSQALYYAGKIQNSKWYEDSPTWINANKFTNYFDGHNEYNVGYNGNQGNCSGIKVGDIISFDYGNNGTFDHVVMVTKKVTNSVGAVLVYYSGHTNNRLDHCFNYIFSNSADNRNANIKSFRPQ